MQPTVWVAFQEKDTNLVLPAISFLWNSEIFPEGEVKNTVPQEGQVPVRCKDTVSLLLSLIFIQNFVSTKSITVYHDKKKSTYYRNHCSGVTQGLLLSCAGGKYRFESFRIEEWNLSPLILTKWKITQGAHSFLNKRVASSIPCLT